MTRKALKIAVTAGLLVVAALTATVVTARTPAKEQIPEYVGSQACLGCHAEKNVAWEDSLHHTSFQLLDNAADYPGDLTTAPAELKNELDKADYIWRGKRFLAQDPVSGELRYLNVQWNATSGQYESYKGGSAWSQSCGGCHSGAVNSGVHSTMLQPGISCESCHGPGRDHILGKGEIAAIVSSTDASATCAQCHSGYNKLPDFTRFATGYEPGTKIEEFEGFLAPVYDPNEAPPHMEDHHMQQYPQWKASAHAGATQLLIEHGETRERCFSCHSASADIQAAKGVAFEYDKHLVNDGVTCASCHDSHGNENPAQLKMDAQALCVSCHNVGTDETRTIGTKRAPHAPQADMLQGTGAIGIAPTTGAHTSLTCIECHMTEGNHMMKVIKPEDVMGTERVDSCTACHTDSSTDSRGVYLSMWQESVSTRMDGLKADVEKIDAALEAHPNALSEEMQAQYLNTRANYWYVMKDKSYGVHNFEYTIKILTQTQQEMAKIKAALRK